MGGNGVLALSGGSSVTSAPICMDGLESNSRVFARTDGAVEDLLGDDEARDKEPGRMPGDRRHLAGPDSLGDTRAMQREGPQPPPSVSLAEATGGWIGIAEATIPFFAFTIVWSASGRNVAAGAAVAVGISATLAILRLLRRETLQFALSGLIGVAFGAFVAARTGDPENFFLPGILINAASFIAYLASIAIRRPLLGLFASALTGEGRRWYEDEERRRAYSRASWIWVGLFGFRLSIQLPLFLSGAVGPLALARVLTGLPLFALALWLSYLLLRAAIGPELRLPDRSR